jgi:hypothetical protein
MIGNLCCKAMHKGRNLSQKEEGLAGGVQQALVNQ